MHDKNRVYLSGAASTDLTGKYCTPSFARFMYNTYPYATTRELVRQGRKTFFLVNPDYALGRSFARDAARSIEAPGGTVRGNVFHPLGMADYGGPLVQAQGAGAEILATGDAGHDLDNLMKQAAEFNYTATHAVLAMNQDAAQVLATEIGLTARQLISPNDIVALPVGLSLPFPVDIELSCRPAGGHRDRGRDTLVLSCTLVQKIRTTRLDARVRLAGVEEIDVQTGIRLSSVLAGRLSGRLRLGDRDEAWQSADDRLLYRRETDFE